MSIKQTIAYYGEQLTSNPKTQAIVGGTVAGGSIPLWLQMVQGYAAVVAAVCGAIIGAFGAYRLLKPVYERHRDCIVERVRGWLK